MLLFVGHEEQNLGGEEQEGTAGGWRRGGCCADLHVQQSPHHREDGFQTLVQQLYQVRAGFVVLDSLMGHGLGLQATLRLAVTILGCML